MYNAPFHFSCQGMDHAGGAAAAERQTSNAFWLLLSFARDALVHLNAIVCSVAAVRERPDPPSVLDGPGLVISAIA